MVRTATPSAPVEAKYAALRAGLRDLLRDGLIVAYSGGVDSAFLLWTAEQVRRAHAVHPIAAVQYEYSLWRREAETLLLPTLRELGVALVAWSPLGAGFLTGTVNSLGANDFRQHNPRFAGQNLATNADRYAPLLQLAGELSITPAQLALAWLMHQGEDVIPIPGTRKAEHIDENARAASIQLDEKQLRQIDALARPGLAEGRTLV